MSTILTKHPTKAIQKVIEAFFLEAEARRQAANAHDKYKDAAEIALKNLPVDSNGYLAETYIVEINAKQFIIHIDVDDNYIVYIEEVVEVDGDNDASN